MNQEQGLQQQLIIFDRFQKLNLIQTYNSYKTHLIKDVFSGDKMWIKTQQAETPKPTILHQAGFLLQMQGHFGIPLMVWSGNINSFQNGLITQKLGKSLQQLIQHQKCKTFSLATVCMIGLQIIKIMESLHDKHILLEYITLDNFRIDQHEVDKIYVTSLLYCRKFRSKRTFKEQQKRKVSVLPFITPFLTLNRLSMFTTSRKDDLQALFYLLVFMKKGELPWSKVIHENKVVTIQGVLEIHKNMSVKIGNHILEDMLSDLPLQFRYIYEHIFSLSFYEKPNYSFIRLKLKKVLSRISPIKQPIFDWIHYLPSLRKQNLKPNQIRWSQYPDKISTSMFFQPFKDKIELDIIEKHHNPKQNYEGVHHVVENGNIRKKNRKDCTLI